MAHEHTHSHAPTSFGRAFAVGVMLNRAFVVAEFLYVGIIINGVTALLFIAGRETDLNIKGAFLHMASDAGVSL